jgi:hypothetical protein
MSQMPPQQPGQPGPWPQGPTPQPGPAPAPGPQPGWGAAGPNQMPPGQMPPGQMPPGQVPQPPAGGGNNNTTLFVVLGVVVLVAVVAGAFFLLSGDDDDGDDRQAYVDVFVAELNTDPRMSQMFSPSDAECAAGAMIDAWGLPALQAAGTPDELATSSADVSAHGLTMDRAWGNTVWANMSGCMNMRQVLKDEATSDPTLTPAEHSVVSCIFDNLDEDDLRDMFVGGMIGEEDPVAQEQAMTRASQGCGP